MGTAGRRGSGSERQKKMPGLDRAAKSDVSVQVSEGVYIPSVFCERISLILISRGQLTSCSTEYAWLPSGEHGRNLAHSEAGGHF